MNVPQVHVRAFVFNELRAEKRPQNFVARHGRPGGVLFNLVDGHLGSEENERKAAEELSALATRFVAATFRKETAPRAFAERMDRVRSSGPMHLYRSRGR